MRMPQGARVHSRAGRLRHAHLLIFHVQTKKSHRGLIKDCIFLSGSDGERLPRLQRHLDYCCWRGVSLQKRDWEHIRSFCCGNYERSYYCHRACTEKDLIHLLPLFAQRGSITCQASGSRRFLDDLVQGGLKISCVLRFEGDAKVTAKVKRLVESALLAATVDLLASKKREVEDASTVLPDTTEDCSS